MKAAALVLAGALLGACSLGPTKEVPATYDFGPARGYPADAGIRASLLVQEVAAPSWLDSSAVVYRLNYHDAARQQVYAQSRWAAPPPSLLTQRLRSRLAAASAGVLTMADNARADYALRVELDDFSHVFDSAASSRAVVAARASLVNTTKRTLIAQKRFAIERPAASANAEGGVRALASAGDDMVEAIAAWTAQSLAQDKK